MERRAVCPANEGIETNISADDSGELTESRGLPR